MKLIIEGNSEELKRVLQAIGGRKEHSYSKIIDGKDILERTTISHLKKMGITDRKIIDAIKTDVEDLLNLK
ncbi:MAG: hypothetical protein ABF624_01525 [Liquorilactobacillus ghanensis]|uniref:hypothetical protein n=1 Tax=Liquorilactobacillus ghanensis TaxID=399370 RepID=UPI0039E92AD5